MFKLEMISASILSQGNRGCQLYENVTILQAVATDPGRLLR